MRPHVSAPSRLIPPASGRFLLAAAALALTLLLLASPLHAADAPAPGPAPAPAPVDLRPRFAPGQVSRFSVWTQRDSVSTDAVPGQAAITRSSRLIVEGQITWQVDHVRADGSAQCTMTYDHLTVSLTNSDGETQSNDSRRSTGDTPVVHGLIRAMAGMPLRLDVAADGAITKVAGGEAIRRRVPEGAPPPEDLDFIESANDLATLPAAPAAASPGQTWDQNFTWTHELGHLQLAARYTFAGVEDIEGIPVATVNAAGSSRLALDRAKLPQGPRIDARLTASSWTSQILFDLARHEAVGRNTNETRQIELRIATPDFQLTRAIHDTIHSQTLRLSEK